MQQDKGTGSLRSGRVGVERRKEIPYLILLFLPAGSQWLQMADRGVEFRRNKMKMGCVKVREEAAKARAKYENTIQKALNAIHTGHDRHHLGKKELKLGRILDGQAITSLYQARKEADLEKATQKAAQETAKHQRAQTSKLYKSAAKTSHQRHPTKRSQTKSQKAASPINIPSDSSSYYEIENQSDDCSESPSSPRQQPPLPPIYLPVVTQPTLGHPASNASSLACLHRLLVASGGLLGSINSIWSYFMHVI
ncbi:hypothetical protein EV426DRAFT_718259 [Tirmania nivea]|nr:hypothetical protein EV426DRAFT_718259 [Tirmania nivea]